MKLLYYLLVFINLLEGYHFIFISFETNNIYDYINDVVTNINLEEFNEIDIFDTRNLIDYSRRKTLFFLNKNAWPQFNLFPYPPPTDEVIRNQGYPCEIHDIVTEDGYILRAFRIPYGKKDKPNKKNLPRPPLLLQHGILCSSDCWTLSDPSKALGFRLADEGYDVWINNNRGTPYSKRHKTLSINDPKFWNYSVHELGTKDLPAVIDHILDTTGYTKLTYVGHSQGTTEFFVLTSVLPEYNDKILVMSAMAPIVFLDEMTGLVRAVTYFSKILMFIAKTFGMNDILDQPVFLHVINHLICNPNSLFIRFCEFWYFIITGFDSPQFNKTLAKPIGDYCPAGASFKQLDHFTQLATSGKFEWYDYGQEGNLKMYNATVPPQYNLTLVTAPVVLHYAMNDYLARPNDVQKLYWILPNLVGLFRVPYIHFNHIDFMWAIDVNKLLYNQAIHIIKQFL